MNKKWLRSVELLEILMNFLTVFFVETALFAAFEPLGSALLTGAAAGEAAAGSAAFQDAFRYGAASSCRRACLLLADPDPGFPVLAVCPAACGRVCGGGFRTWDKRAFPGAVRFFRRHLSGGFLPDKAAGAAGGGRGAGACGGRSSRRGLPLFCARIWRTTRPAAGF